MRRLQLAAAALFAAFALVVLAAPPFANADIPAVAFGPTSFTGTGNMPVINLTGQSTCSMTLAGGGTATITPKGQTAGGGFGTISGIGAQTSNGTYSGSSAPYVSQFYVAVTGVTGTVSVSESCTAAVPVSSGGGGGGASPCPTDGNGNCKVALQTWPSTAPAYTLPATTPAPAPTGTGGVLASTQYKVGTGAIYYDTWPDTLSVTGSITTATTTQVVAGVANQNMYCFAFGVEITGTNSAAIYTFGWGTAGATNVIPPATGVSTSGSTGMYNVYGNAIATATGAIVFGWAPAAVPFIIPANSTPNNLYVVSSGTTMAVKGYAYCSIHAN